MIIYNITVNIENDVRDEWLQWMKTHHIPQVMATGHFLEHKICKVLVNEEQGTTFSIQYTAPSMETYEKYKTLHAPKLQKEYNDKYASKSVAFRTLLEII